MYIGNQLLHSSFLEQARFNGQGPCLEIGEKSWSYRELANLAIGFALEMRKLGVRRNSRVGLLLPKSEVLYAGVLGALIAGGAYVPLEPDYPVERLRHIAESADLDIVVYNSNELLNKVFDGLANSPHTINGYTIQPAGPEALDGFPVEDVNTPKDLAYILFTSGSTGKPKGVMVTHENACSFVDWAIDKYQINHTDRMSNHSDLTFDLSVFDLFAAWRSGATLIPLTTLVDKTMPGEFIRKHRISIWFSVPSVLAGMSAGGQISTDLLGKLRAMIFCGEPLPPGPVRDLMTTVPELLVSNFYGPTEATVACSSYDLPTSPAEDAKGIPIGWRTGTTEVFVWKEGGGVAKSGETGEICIAGSQVSPGYWRNPTETSARFVEDPRFLGVGAPCYKTGDIALVCPEGPVFMGRKDNQVKYRGWRIELGDIENALLAIEGIAEAAVVLKKTDGAPEELVGFVRSSIKTKPDKILQKLGSKMPSYMVPTRIRLVQDFPRTLNGKIDRKQL